MTELLTATQPLVRIDGELVDSITFDLASLRVRSSVEGLDTLELELFAQRDAAEPALQLEPRYLDGEVFDFGKRVEVVMGSHADGRVVFDGTISALEAEFEDGREPKVTVFAEDRLMEMRLTRRSRTWQDKSDAEIARAIADVHGLDADVDVDGPTWETVQQWNMSDLAFLRERALLIGAELWVEHDKLSFKSRAARTGTELTLVRGNELLHLVARADLAHQRAGVRVRGWDADRAEAIDVHVPGSIIRETIGGVGRTGPEVLEQTFGERNSVLVREVPHNREQADAIARAAVLRRARGFVRVTGISSGSPNMVVGSRLILQRVGLPFEGAGYYVTSLCHSYERELGYRTQFDAERATIEGGTSA